MTAALVVLAFPSGAAGAGARTANEDAEVEMSAAIDEVRAAHGLAPLRGSRSLARSAGRYSHWLMEHDLFGHAERIRASARFALLGEALAWHSGRRFDVRGTLDRWMSSPSHRAIVLSPVMTRAGAGVTRGLLSSRPATMWVLHVGRLDPPGAEVPAPEVSLP